VLVAGVQKYEGTKTVVGKGRMGAFRGRHWSGFPAFPSAMRPSSRALMCMQVCHERNVHGRSLADIEELAAHYDPPPHTLPCVDMGALLSKNKIKSVKVTPLLPFLQHGCMPLMCFFSMAASCICGSHA
jgi:hypothetical protein